MGVRQRRRRHQRRMEHAERRHWRTRQSVVTGAGVAAGTALGLAAPAAGAPLELTVDNLADPADVGTCLDATPNDCSLRQAVTAANSNAGEGDYIVFQAGLTGTIALTSAAGGQIPITDPVYIYGNGPEATTVTAAPGSRIFHTDMTTPGDEVGIYSMTLSGGNVTGIGGAAKGGAIYSYDAILHISDSVFTGNTAGQSGGAVYKRARYMEGDYDTTSYTTFTDNHAGSDGGAISTGDGFGVVLASTLQGNTAAQGAAMTGNGDVVDSTISGNHSTHPNGAGAVFGNVIGIYSSIVASNTGGAYGTDVDALIDVYAVNSLVGNPGTPLSGGANIVGQDPQLGSLGMNGGALPTMKPAASSPVVDKGFSGAQLDQRELTRVIDNPNVPNAGNGADIGAVELSVAEGPGPASAPAPTAAIKRKKCKKKATKRSAIAAKKKCKKKKRKQRRSARIAERASFAAPAWPDRARPFAAGS